MKNTSTPFDLNALDLVGDDWRANFSWPAPMADLFCVVRELQRRYVDLLLASTQVEREIFLLARPLGQVSAILEAAIAVQSEGESEKRLVGPPELEVLRGSARPSDVGEGSVFSMGDRHLKLDARFLFARRLLRAISWTRPSRLVKMLAAPSGLAVTHNQLLRDHIRHSNLAVKFIHASSFFSLPEGSDFCSLGLDREQAEEFAEKLTFVFSDDRSLSDTMKERVRGLILPIAYKAIVEALFTRATLSRRSDIPTELFSGTGSFFPARAVGLEVLRRGGSVVRGDHGGTSALLEESEFIVQSEFLVSSAFIVPTRKAADSTVFVKAREISLQCGSLEIVPGRGDRSLCPGVPRVRNNRRKARGPRRVLFVGTAYYGFSQTFPPFPPGPVYLDWQHRVLNTLSELPIELVHKPHPGGWYNGKPPGLSRYSEMLGACFEDVLNYFDLLVFDCPASTTFSIALSSDIPVVLLDFGAMRFNSTVSPYISERCSVVPVFSDESNRLVFDVGSLKEAVLSAAPAKGYHFFRQLFLGDVS